MKRNNFSFLFFFKMIRLFEMFAGYGGSVQQKIGNFTGHQKLERRS